MIDETSAKAAAIHGIRLVAPGVPLPPDPQNEAVVKAVAASNAAIRARHEAAQERGRAERAEAAAEKAAVAEFIANRRKGRKP